MIAKEPNISCIVAMAENRVIGKDNDLSWKIPADLKRFKAITMGKPIIMGRKCWESLGRPLPGRMNIVVSRSISGDLVNENGPFYVDSIENALKLAKTARTDEVFIIGGGEIYRQTMPMVQKLYLTLVHRDYDGDVFFPEFNRTAWREVSKEHHAGEPDFTFVVLGRS